MVDIARSADVSREHIQAGLQEQKGNTAMNDTDEGTLSARPTRSPFEVVALVASAGGVEAISALVRHLPADFPAAVIVMLHLGPGKNHLIEILDRASELPVQWATRYEPFQPGRVYVCPSRQMLLVQPDRTCDLEPYDSITQSRPISAFLQSLAESYGPHALAVILTGMWKDGVEGVQALKASGGTVLVQSQESAIQPGMPHAAIATGVIDGVLPLQELAHVIPSIVTGGQLPRSYSEIEAVSALFRGHDETSASLRDMAWERTAFGPVSRWPVSLTTTVRLMMDNGVAMALFWGPELRMLYNNVYRPLLGSNHPQAIGLPAHEVYRDIWQHVEPLFQQVTTFGQALHRDDQHWTLLRNGRVEDVYATSDYSPVRDEQGNVQGVLLTVLETTGHVLAERRAMTLRQLAAPILHIDDQREVCEHVMQILGHNPDDVPFALLYFVDAPRVTLRLGAATGIEAGTFAAPHVIHVSEGNPVWPLATVLEQGKPLVLDDLTTRIRGLSTGSQMRPPSSAILLPLTPLPEEHIQGVLIIGLSTRGIFDTPYREFLELVAAQVSAGFATARAAQRDAERMEALTALDRAKTDFFSNISHEFRTPLTLLLGPLEHILKQHDQLPSAALDDLYLVQRNASQLHKLVNTLLDFSRIEAKRARLDREPTDLAALTRDLASLFRSAVEQAGLTFIVDCPPLAALVAVDREMWEKIVLNLLSNALKFTFRGSISLTLRALPGHIELVVADTGIGIPEEEQPHLFQRFHRIARTRGRTQQGSGIGLALVQEYVRLHGGRVRVRSQVDTGTTFTIWIPLTQQASIARNTRRDDASA
ncbi:MAG TPA: hypothetical protein DHW02_21610, partial [Ktedonobacter sp.]|nr:hypothetical protein [Ktedonobacter sp.]